MRFLLVLIVALFSCKGNKNEDPEPTMKKCDSVYTEIVAARCCGMTGSGGVPANGGYMDCQNYDYCVEYYFCEKP